MLTDRFITKQTMDRFYEYLIEEERSSGTIEKYIRDVRLLQSWLGLAGHEGECCPVEARASAKLAAHHPRSIPCWRQPTHIFALWAGMSSN